MHRSAICPSSLPLFLFTFLLGLVDLFFLSLSHTSEGNRQGGRDVPWSNDFLGTEWMGRLISCVRVFFIHLCCLSVRLMLNVEETFIRG